MAETLRDATRITDPCPSCGMHTLEMVESGDIVCTLIGCKDPTWVHRIMNLPRPPLTPADVQVGDWVRFENCLGSWCIGVVLEVEDGRVSVTGGAQGNEVLSPSRIKAVRRG
jgi:hypothetical protein